MDGSAGQLDSRPRSLFWLVAILLLLATSVVILRSGPSGSSGQDSPALGKRAPRLDLIRLSDEPFLDPLNSVPPGDVTLIHFWGTWCGPCKMEYPHLSTMANRMQTRPRFRFLSVSCEGGQETLDGLRRKTQDYFTSENLGGVAYADPRGVTRRSAAERLERSSIFYPTSILVAADGTIAGVWEGYTPEAVEQMETMIVRLLDRVAVRT